MKQKNKIAFTLIELLVAVFIIAALLTLSLVSFNSGRSKARDSKRLSDVARIQQALEIYKQQEGHYPLTMEFGGALIGTTSSTTYLSIIPEEPSVSDGTCDDSENAYVYTSDGDTTYTLSFCLGGKSGQLSSGLKCATPKGILNVSCEPDESESYWQYVGTNTGFSIGIAQYTNIKFLGSTPYVAYVDYGDDGRVWVKSYNGSSWVQVGDNSGLDNQTMDCDMEIDGSQIYFGYIDNDWDGGKPSVLKYNGSSWDYWGNSDFTPSFSERFSIAVEGDYTYAAFRDYGAENKLSVMSSENGGNWTLLGDRGFSDNKVDYTDIFIYDGHPYVAYEENSKLYVKMYTGIWIDLGAQPISDGTINSNSLSLFVASDGTPYVAYTDTSIFGSKLSVKKYNGSSWEYVGGQGFTPNEGYNPKIFVYNNTPYVAFSDTYDVYKASVMKYNGSSWEYVGTNGFSAGKIAHLSFYVYNGTPYVAYQDYNNNYKINVMKYAP